MDPQDTIELLNALVPLGFDDCAFQVLHHFHGGAAIAGHLEYCQNVQTHFREGGNNAQVQHRLEIVLAAYEGGGFDSHSPEVFRHLAEAGVVEVPF